jgi:RimJ/RimL family protein N-acetyltransferase
MATINTRVFSLGDARNATVRNAEAADAAEVLAFRKIVADETEFLMGAADEIRRGIAQQAEHLQATLLSPVDLLVLAEVEGRVAGVAGLEGSRLRRFAHGVTLGIAVRREFWRLGLGRALMESLLLWADTHGVVRVALEVVETNTPAIRLYASLGFEHEGRLRARRKHGDVYVDNYIMSRVRGALRGPTSDGSGGAVAESDRL